MSTIPHSPKKMSGSSPEAEQAPAIARPRKGRGAVSNPGCRYEATTLEAYDDGWGSADADPEPLAVQLMMDTARKVITYNQSPDLPFDRSINPYKGCEHGCVYCYARPTHAYLGHSPGLDFESQLYHKPDAPALLREELAKATYQCKPIAIGMNTDAWQPIERKVELTREILKVLSEAKHPFSTVTKSAMVERDMDVIVPMAEQGMAQVMISIATLNKGLARTMEPRAASPQRRLQTLKTLSDAGVETGVLIAPVIPGLNDHELEAIMAASYESGAKQVAYVLLRLPLEINELFGEWLQWHEPNKASKVMSLIHQCRGGKAYQSDYGSRFTGQGPVADVITQRYRLMKKKLGLNEQSIELCIDKFRRPMLSGTQYELF